MTGRYLLIASTDPITRPIGERPLIGTLPSAYRDGRYQLYADEALPWQLVSEETGILVGHVFARSSGDQDHPFVAGRNPEACREETLLRHCWGSYVASFVQGSNIRLFRDPSGTLPCFVAMANGLLFASSDVALIFEAMGQAPRIDWDALTRLLYVNELPQEETALSGVRDLLSGWVLDYDGCTVSSRMIWSPWDHVDERNAPARAELERRIANVVKTISGSFKSVLVGVSGGLDSSIVAACAMDSAARVRPITISTDDAHGDEAAFAGALCTHLGLPLIRESYRLETVDIARSTVAHLPRPGGRAQLQAYDHAALDHAERLGCDAFLTGVGGDNVFGYTNSARPLVDRYLAHGLGRHLLATARDIAQLTGASWREVLRFAFAVPRARGEPRYRWRPDPRFLATHHRERLGNAPLRHGWLDAPPDGLPGKAAHIAMLIRAAHYVDAQSRALPIAFVQPLLAQPIIEMCLAIPSWRACAGGMDRSAVRQAFAGRLPPSIIQRRTKGGPDGFAHQILRHHLVAIRERLLGGVLAEHGIIDIVALDTQVREDTMMRGIDYVRILLLLDTEAWARHWMIWRPPGRQTVNEPGPRFS